MYLFSKKNNKKFWITDFLFSSMSVSCAYKAGFYFPRVLQIRSIGNSWFMKETKSFAPLILKMHEQSLFFDMKFHNPNSTVMTEDSMQANRLAFCCSMPIRKVQSSKWQITNCMMGGRWNRFYKPNICLEFWIATWNFRKLGHSHKVKLHVAPYKPVCKLQDLGGG